MAINDGFPGTLQGRLHIGSGGQLPRLDPERSLKPRVVMKIFLHINFGNEFRNQVV